MEKIYGLPLFPIPSQFGTEEETQVKLTSEILFKEFFCDEYGNNPMVYEIGRAPIDKLGGFSNIARIKLESDYLKAITYKRANSIYGDKLPSDIDARLKYELQIIKMRGLSNYFLLVQDVINSIRKEIGAIVAPAWGKESGSLVAYCLGITKVDPMKCDLLFENFIRTTDDSFPLMYFLINREAFRHVKDWLIYKFGESLWQRIVLLPSETLSNVKAIVTAIKTSRNIDIEWDKIPLDDKETLYSFKDGRYESLWSYEYKPIKFYSPKFIPSSFEDLTIMSAFIHSGLTFTREVYLKRKNGDAEFGYEIPCMERYTKETCGLLVYEEQLALLLCLLADFSREESYNSIYYLRMENATECSIIEDNFIRRGFKNGHPKKILQKLWSEWRSCCSAIKSKSSVVNEVWLSYLLTFYEVNYPEEYQSVMAKK